MPPVDIDAAVIENRRLSRDYSVLSLAAPEVGKRTQPGQFVMVKPAGVTDPLLRRPFSVFEVLRDARGNVTGVSILNKRAGRSTKKLYELEVGDVVSCLGPLGVPYTPVQAPMEGWMVAGGVGLAPFSSLAEALAVRKTPMTLFYGARSRADLFYEDAFEKLGARMVLTTEDGSRGEAGRVTAPLERALNALPENRQVTIYACGPTPMMRAVAQIGARFHRPAFVSLEPVMGCGMGGCYSCVVRVRRGASANFVRSCLEGPVFDASAVVWDELHRHG